MHPILTLALNTPPSPAFDVQFHDWKTTQLPLGDPQTFVVLCADGTSLACRYMKTGELLDYVRTGRLIPMGLALRERSPWAYLILDGQLTPNTSGKTVNNGNVTGFDWKAIQGSLLSLQETGTGIVTLEATTHLQDQVYLLAKRDRNASRIRPPRDVLFVSVPEDILLAFPGVGEVHCREILHFTNGDGAAALDALLDPHHPIPGVNPKIQVNARKALGLPETLRLGLIDVTNEVPV